MSLKFLIEKAEMSLLWTNTSHFMFRVVCQRSQCRGSASSSACTVTLLTLDPFILKMMSSD